VRQQHVVYVLIGAAVLLAALLRYHGWRAEKYELWQADAARVEAEAERERARADSATKRADSLAADAGRQKARADSLATANARLSDIAASLRTRIDTVRVPAEALPYTAPRDSLIRVQAQQIQTQAAEVSALRNANALLVQANDTLRLTVSRISTTVDSLTAVLHRRPHRDRWYVPEIGIGAHAGLNALDGYRVSAGPSVNATWRVKF
jgi:chromosome segregation ATPase